MISFVPEGYPRRSASGCAEIVSGKPNRKQPSSKRTDVDFSLFSTRLRCNIDLLYCGKRWKQKPNTDTGCPASTIQPPQNTKCQALLELGGVLIRTLPGDVEAGFICKKFRVAAAVPSPSASKIA